MRPLLILLLVVGLFALPTVAGDQTGCPYSQKVERSNCCQHMCPVAQSSTRAGYETVSQMPLAVMTLAELDS